MNLKSQKTTEQSLLRDYFMRTLIIQKQKKNRKKGVEFELLHIAILPLGAFFFIETQAYSCYIRI
jgi:hypothetical protein